ncbi:SAV_915 family protein [Jiangella endophytica]|uniref:SAV_915 family protein n=1 Tax=Jiangella endophytica TaxID=1623398 RepID=UPI000E34163E|nr:SAV_915 family protein [Jiangella endophytica]
MEHSQPLFVPVRPAGQPPTSCRAVVTARLPEGGRVGLAFTSAEALAAAMGPSQQWIRLGLAAERALLAPLGVGRIQVDPVLVAPPVPVGARRAA